MLREKYDAITRNFPFLKNSKEYASKLSLGIPIDEEINDEIHSAKFSSKKASISKHKPSDSKPPASLHKENSNPNTLAKRPNPYSVPNKGSNLATTLSKDPSKSPNITKKIKY